MRTKSAKLPRPKILGVDRACFAGSRVLGVLLCLVGVAMVASTVARGGGPLALGVVLGALFAVLGAAGSCWPSGSGRAGDERPADCADAATRR